MTRFSILRRVFPVVFILTTIFMSCMSGAPELGQDWNEEKFFKSAHEAFDEDRLDWSLFY
jgi:NADH:ubiquinone oxidoreductase subunit 5 (subunit L)/multisubunit Na+/H+ antiporter MnhA subunit